MDLLYWHWLVLGLGLLCAEMLIASEFVLLWMGVSAVVVGLLTMLLPLNWQIELVLFGVLSIVSYFTYRKFRPTIENDKPTLNRRGHSYIGRVFELSEAIVNGMGKVHVDDSQWRVSGPDTAAGSRVRVIEVDGTTFKVELAE
ncbi:NfeD family protein [Stenotrophobium rhamnosiphilum]|nr:NfeD family protein [Stenotrophobium rhamnosiphilum]